MCCVVNAAGFMKQHHVQAACHNNREIHLRGRHDWYDDNKIQLLMIVVAPCRVDAACSICWAGQYGGGSIQHAACSICPIAASSTQHWHTAFVRLHHAAAACRICLGESCSIQHAVSATLRHVVSASMPHATSACVQQHAVGSRQHLREFRI